MTRCAVRGCENEGSRESKQYLGVFVCEEHPEDEEQYVQAPDGTLIATPND